MKKVVAFVTAFVMFLVSAVTIHFVSIKSLEADSREMGVWINTKKDLSYHAVASNLKEDTYLILGSSEFNHGKDTKYHPSNLFRKANLNVMLIGAAKNQSLSHALTLGAVGNDLKTKKVALIVSPSWFSKKGIDKTSFSARFSETNYLALMDNENLSDELKQKFSKRIEELLDDGLTVKENFMRNNRILKSTDLNLKDSVTNLVHKKIVAEQEIVSTGILWKFSDKAEWQDNTEIHEPDWNSLIEEADDEFLKNSSNEFYMSDSIFKHKVMPMYAERKDKDSKRTYGTSPEYDDLKLFLDVCRELGIEAELILLPVNGYWYDYTGFPVENREVIVEKLQTISNEYGAKMCSFFDQCYTPGFLEDIVHPAGKGWVKINEEIFSFFTKN